MATEATDAHDRSRCSRQRSASRSTASRSPQFTEISGVIDRDRDRSTTRTSTTGKVTIRKLPGKPKPPTITLKRGNTGPTELWDWHRPSSRATPDRRNGSVILMNTTARRSPATTSSTRWPSKVSTARSRRRHDTRPDGGGTLVCESSSRPRPMTAAMPPEPATSAREPNASDGLRTEYAFVLPRGFVDGTAPSIVTASCAWRPRATRSCRSATRGSARTRRT